MSALPLLQLRRLTDSPVGAVLGGLLYGAWATAANWDAGGSMALRIGGAHWLSSALLTYFGTAVMRRLFRLRSRPRDGAVLAFGGELLLTYTVLIAVHTLLGTPHLLLTLAAGVVPNLLFCSAYAALLARTEPACDDEAPLVVSGV